MNSQRDHEQAPTSLGDLDAHIRASLETWPQLDPEVEGIVTRIAKAYRYIEDEARASLARVGLTKEEFKVLMALQRNGSQSHGSLCRRCDCSTGAMTNRLDKLERTGLLARSPDPHDRRGVLLELTARGREKLDEYIDTGSSRELELLSGMTADERRQLNGLLQRLIGSLQAELGKS
jgi:DNA-binding MarR family transcriptional regulator